MEIKLSISRSRNKENTPTIVNGSGSGTFISTSDIGNLVSSLTSGDKFNINTTNKHGQQKAYDDCALVSSIIGKRSQYSSNGKYLINGKPIEEVPLTNSVKKLLTAPNPLQTISEFHNQINIYRDTFGYCPIYKVYPANRSTGLPTAIWAINPLYFEITLTNKIVNQTRLSDIVQSITFNMFNSTELITLKGEDINRIYILKGRNSDKLNPVIMKSPLYDCSDAVSNFNGSVNVYGNLIKQSILGIISNRTNDAAGYLNAGDESDRVNEQLESRYGLVSGKNNFVVSNANLFFQSLMANAANLQIPANIKISVNTLCNKLGFSPELLADEQSKFENKKIAEIGHYQNETIPDANEYARALSEITGAEITIDYGHVSVLQGNKKEMVDSFSSLVNSLTTAINSGLIQQNDAIEILEKYKP